MAAAEAAFGGLDVIVNSAAVHPYGTVVDTSPEVWARCMAVNVGSIHLTAHFGVPAMRRRGGGAIVNVASVQGHACQQNVAAYVATKGAIHALTRAMALDHAREDIRVKLGPVRARSARRSWRRLRGGRTAPRPTLRSVFQRFGACAPARAASASRRRWPS